MNRPTPSNSAMSGQWTALSEREYRNIDPRRGDLKWDYFPKTGATIRVSPVGKGSPGRTREYRFELIGDESLYPKGKLFYSQTTMKESAPGSNIYVGCVEQMDGYETLHEICYLTAQDEKLIMAHELIWENDELADGRLATVKILLDENIVSARKWDCEN